MDTSAVSDSKLWEKVQSTSESTNWMLMAVESRTKLVVFGSGSGGFSEMTSKLEKSKVMFGVFKVVGVDRKGGRTSSRDKFIFFDWLPEGAPVMARARVSAQLGSIRSLFAGIHITMSAGEMEDLSKEAIIGKLRASGGAHQPDEYDFLDSGDSAAGADAEAAPAPEPAAAPEPVAAAAPEPAPAPAPEPEPEAEEEAPAAAEEAPAAAEEEAPAAAEEEAPAAAEEEAAAAEEEAPAAEEEAAAAEEAPAAEDEAPAAEEAPAAAEEEAGDVDEETE